jgi:hypothetical protein
VPVAIRVEGRMFRQGVPLDDFETFLQNLQIDLT